MIQRTHRNVRGAERSPFLQPGEVISGNVVNGIENLHASGKLRPVVVVDASMPGHLIVIGLTSRATTHKGKQRVEIVDNMDWEWRGRSYVFGGRLTRLSRIDVGDHIGWISANDGETLANVFGLAGNWMTNNERSVA